MVQMAFEKYTSPVNNTLKPCRAFAILACDAPLAVILRRGPSDWVQLIRWETTSDNIEYGQWFKGRIYERRCDLSPNGKLFLYFARKTNKKMLDEQSYTDVWTAVSKPPYFTALALWPKGNSWNGGGVFDDDRTIRLNHNPERMAAHPDHEPSGLSIIMDFDNKGEDASIYPQLLLRHGWEFVQDGHGEYKEPKWRWKLNQPNIWRKTIKRYGLSLLMKLIGSKQYYYGDKLVLEYLVVDEQTNKTYPIENATWADWDQQGRLVYIAKGLLIGQQFKSELKLPRVIADLNPQVPYSVTTPEWATTW
jgi:hypothetical protein